MGRKNPDYVLARTTCELAFGRPVCFYDDKEHDWVDTEATNGIKVFPPGTLVTLDRNNFSFDPFNGQPRYACVSVRGLLNPFVLYEVPAAWIHLLSPLEQLAECAE